jgi:hypothetical protein
MVRCLRSWAVWLFLIAACSGPTFTAGAPNAGGHGSESGAALAGGGDGSAGGSDAPIDGGAAGHADGSGELVPGGQGGANELGEGGAPVCAVKCRGGEECLATPAGPECRCAGAFVRVGDEQCRLPLSCDELHRYAPLLPSAAYALQPKEAASSFEAYCGMVQEGGGWTLVVNEGTDFDPSTSGTGDEVCYSSSCTNLGYSLVPVKSDVMLDVSDSAISGSTYSARLVVTGVHAMSRGKTMRTLFTTGPNYVEAENNSNLAVRMRNGVDCESLPQDFASAACRSCDTAGCKQPVLVFGDDDGDPACNATVPRFALGAAKDYAMPWNNCAGWPQHPAYSGTSFYPLFVRVWVR